MRRIIQANIDKFKLLIKKPKPTQSELWKSDFSTRRRQSSKN